jgi:hypothetical protein
MVEGGNKLGRAVLGGVIEERVRKKIKTAGF